MDNRHQGAATVSSRQPASLDDAGLRDRWRAAAAGVLDDLSLRRGGVCCFDNLSRDLLRYPVPIIMEFLRRLFGDLPGGTNDHFAQLVVMQQTGDHAGVARALTGWLGFDPNACLTQEPLRDG